MRKVNMLSAKEVETAKPQKRAYKLIDGEGLYLYVTPAGGKLWRLKYRRPDDKEDTLCLGMLAHVSLKKARELKLEAKKKLAEGIDPKEEKKRLKSDAEAEKRKVVLTFEKVGREWFEKKSLDKQEGYKKLLRNRLENQIFPAFGSVAMEDIDAPTILNALRKVENRGSYDMAKRLARITRQICSYAVACGYVKHNAASEIMAGLSSGGSVQHRAAITDPKQVGQLLRALDEYDGCVTIKYALRILPYVFVRSQELRGAKWKEIDFQKALWTIPAERMKMKKVHVVPLARQVLAILGELYGMTGADELVFPSPQSRSRCISDMGLLNALRRLGYDKDQMCIHGFRAMASTLLNEQQYPSDIIEMQLAHSESDNSRRPYNRAQYLKERQKMMQEWADYLDKLRAAA